MQIRQYIERVRSGEIPLDYEVIMRLIECRNELEDLLSDIACGVGNHQVIEEGQQHLDDGQKKPCNKIL